MSFFFIASCSGVKQNKSKVIISHIPAEAVDVLIEKSQIASSSTYLMKRKKMGGQYL
jgi:hypothetical protein